MNSNPNQYNVGLDGSLQKPNHIRETQYNDSKIRNNADRYINDTQYNCNNQRVSYSEIDVSKLPIRGAKDNSPVSFDPKTGMLYTKDPGMTYEEFVAILASYDTKFSNLKLDITNMVTEINTILEHINYSGIAKIVHLEHEEPFPNNGADYLDTIFIRDDIVYIYSMEKGIFIMIDEKDEIDGGEIE